MTQWILTDPLDSSTYALPHNPREASSPGPHRRQTETFAPVGADIPFARSTPVLVEWTFSIRYYDATEVAALRDWCRKKRLIHITDHLGRTYEVVVMRGEAVEALPSRRRPNRGVFNVACNVVRRVS